MPSRDVVLDVIDLHKHYPVTKGLLRRVVGNLKAVDGVSFSLRENEAIGLVGESGCGKTTVIRSIMRAVEPTKGQVLFRLDGEMVDIVSADKPTLQKIRSKMQMVFQDPYSSLNPRMMVKDLIGEPLRINYQLRGKEVDERVVELLELVGLSPQFLNRYPHAFSGGQRQRLSIARALALQPNVLLLDEPTSALDVSVQAQVLNLLIELQKHLGLSYIFISHDLKVVQHISDRVIVMYVGNIVEIAETKKLFEEPRHPYTRALLSAIPEITFEDRPKIFLKGEVPDPACLPKGCPFQPRCAYRKQICQEKKPSLLRQKDSGSHFVACHFADNISNKTGKV